MTDKSPFFSPQKKEWGFFYLSGIFDGVPAFRG